MRKDLYTIINGPNLNLLGIREPSIYGNQSFDEYIFNLREAFSDVLIAYHQSNHEGEIIDLIHHYGIKNAKGIIINAGGYTHTSISIADAIKSVSCPVVEVHISNIYERESYRQFSYLKEVCVKEVIGKGLKGYDLALSYLVSKH